MFSFNKADDGPGDCGSEFPCQNEGVCIVLESGEERCECPSENTGEKCEYVKGTGRCLFSGIFFMNSQAY